MTRFTYHCNSFHLLFKAVPNLVQNIAFEKMYLPIRHYSMNDELHLFTFNWNRINGIPPVLVY